MLDFRPRPERALPAHAVDRNFLFKNAVFDSGSAQLLALSWPPHRFPRPSPLHPPAPMLCGLDSGNPGVTSRSFHPATRPGSLLIVCRQRNRRGVEPWIPGVYPSYSLISSRQLIYFSLFHRFSAHEVLRESHCGSIVHPTLLRLPTIALDGAMFWTSLCPFYWNPGCHGYAPSLLHPSKPANPDHHRPPAPKRVNRNTSLPRHRVLTQKCSPPIPAHAETQISVSKWNIPCPRARKAIAKATS